MMSLSLIVANLGPYACALPPPISVSFRDPTNRHLLADSNRLARDLTLTTIRPTRPLRIDDVSPPAGSGYIWMLWTWRTPAEGACVLYDPPLVTVVATFAEFELEASAPIKLGVCEGTLGIAGFGRIPPAD